MDQPRPEKLLHVSPNLEFRAQDRSLDTLALGTDSFLWCREASFMEGNSGDSKAFFNSRIHQIADYFLQTGGRDKGK